MFPFSTRGDIFQGDIKSAFDWSYSGIRMRRFMSKNHIYENFDVIGIEIRFVPSFPSKILLRNRPPFNSKELFLFRLFLFQNRVNRLLHYCIIKTSLKKDFKN